MSTNVEPEELDTILDGVAASIDRFGRVVPRDFSRPQRLSALRLTDLERTLADTLSRLPSALLRATDTRLGARHVGLGEVDAEGLFESLEEPLVALRFLCGGQVGWALWECAGAVRLVESMLGSSTSSGEARALSVLEGRLAGDVLAAIVGWIADGLGASLTDAELVGEAAMLGSWKEASETPDAHRLDVELELEIAGASSALHVYLPGFLGGGSPEEQPSPALPAHLDEVHVELSARLATTEILLSQLLGLEEGDVIPTGARVDDLAQLLIEGRPIAYGHMGKHRGRRAVRIERLEAHREVER